MYRLRLRWSMRHLRDRFRSVSANLDPAAARRDGGTARTRHIRYHHVCLGNGVGALKAPRTPATIHHHRAGVRIRTSALMPLPA